LTSLPLAALAATLKRLGCRLGTRWLSIKVDRGLYVTDVGCLTYAIGVEVPPSTMMEILLRAGVSRWFSEVALLVNANRDIVETACAGLIGAPAHVVVWNELHRDSFSKFLVVTSFQPVPEPCTAPIIRPKRDVLQVVQESIT
jgi:hypothetical protein